MTTEYRAQKITIDIPDENSEPFILVTVQRVIKNDAGEVIQIIDRDELIYKSFSDMATTHATYNDIYPKDGMISGYGSGSSVLSFVRKWIREECG